jgi:hypothetical protein
MLHGLVTELVVPSIKQKDSEVRASGLVCLGLVSLLDKVSLRVLPETMLADFLSRTCLGNGARLV